MGYGEKIQAVPNIALTAGERKYSVLQSKVRTRTIRLTAEAVVDVTVDFTSLRNRGSILALIDEVGLEADGEDRLVIEPRICRAWSDYNAISALPATRLTNFTAALVNGETYRETMYLHLANPRIARPEETSFLERDPQTEMRVFAKYNGLAAKLFGGAGTAVITAPIVRVTQIYDPFRADLPLLRPYSRQKTEAITGANDALEISLKGSKYVGGMVIQQDSDAGEVTDMINTIALRGDDGRDIIPQPVNWADMVRHQSLDFGGDSASLAYLGINFVRDGRLNQLVHPYNYQNLRLVLNVQPSVTVGATNGKVRVTMFEYDRDAELTAPSLPFVI